MKEIYDNSADLERHFGLPEGSLLNIPYYARRPAIDAILKVREMENQSIFRPGLYYIVLSDLCAQTAFNVKYGDQEGDIRVQWFQTAVIEAIGQLNVRNYVAFSKTIGDASLLIFSSLLDVFEWSDLLTSNLDSLSQEYVERANENFGHLSEGELDELIAHFELRARRLVHLGEVAYKGERDPLSLAVSQAFKVEKAFGETDLGCTQPVADVAKAKLLGERKTLIENKMVEIPGIGETMTYYFKRTLVSGSG